MKRPSWWSMRLSVAVARASLKRLLSGDLAEHLRDAEEGAERALTRIGELEARVIQLESDLTAMSIENTRQAEENELHGFLVAALTEELVRFRGESQRQAIVGRVSAYVDERARIARQQRAAAQRKALLDAAREGAPDQEGARNAPADAPPAAQEPAAAEG